MKSDHKEISNYFYTKNKLPTKEFRVDIRFSIIILHNNYKGCCLKRNFYCKLKPTKRILIECLDMFFMGRGRLTERRLTDNQLTERRLTE
jgi:hypothetical protein